MASCKLCQRPGALGDRGACDDCLGRLGFSVPIPRADAPQSGCARCGHRTLIRALLRERTASSYARGMEELRPLAVTFGFNFSHGFFQGQRPEEDPARPIGILEARVCRSCGFTDLYVQRPAEIPIGPEYGTELLEAVDTAPYR